MTAPFELPALGWIDWSFIAILALSLLVGLWRGFVFEVMSLAGWLVAWFGSQWAAPQLVPHLPVAVAGSPLRMAAALVLCFVGILVAWALLARLLRLLIHATPLSIPDRLLGAGFGVLRGGVLLLAVASVLALTPAAQSTAWRTSQGARWLEISLQALKPLLPPGVQDWLPPQAVSGIRA